MDRCLHVTCLLRSAESAKAVCHAGQRRSFPDRGTWRERAAHRTPQLPGGEKSQVIRLGRALFSKLPRGLLRGLGQSPEPVVVLQPGAPTLAQVAQPTQPERAALLGALPTVSRSFLPANQGTPPTALSPLRRQNPREEPGALAAHAGICAGGEE